jgi:hypothetical protein
MHAYILSLMMTHWKEFFLNFSFCIQEIEEEEVCIINCCYDMKNRYEFAVVSVRKDFFYILFLFAQFMHYWNIKIQNFPRFLKYILYMKWILKSNAISVLSNAQKYLTWCYLKYEVNKLYLISSFVAFVMIYCAIFISIHRKFDFLWVTNKIMNF